MHGQTLGHRSPAEPACSGFVWRGLVRSGPMPAGWDRFVWFRIPAGWPDPWPV